MARFLPFSFKRLKHRSIYSAKKTLPISIKLSEPPARTIYQWTGGKHKGIVGIVVEFKANRIDTLTVYYHSRLQLLCSIVM